jgi:hypothetical protein
MDIETITAGLGKELTPSVRALIDAKTAEIKRLRAALLKFVDHFGPLENNIMVHEDARECFILARKALGDEEHDRAIKHALKSK